MDEIIYEADCFGETTPIDNQNISGEVENNIKQSGLMRLSSYDLRNILKDVSPRSRHYSDTMSNATTQKSFNLQIASTNYTNETKKISKIEL